MERMMRKVEAKHKRPAHLDRVHWNWDVWKGCNYACIYCDVYVPMNKVNVADHPTADKWLEAWRRMHDLYGTCSMRVAGGEPIVYPGFLELLNELTKIFVMEVSTNLSVPWQRIADTVSPMNLRLHTSFHPEYAEREKFLDKLVNLRARGFQLSVTSVTHPRTLGHLEETKKLFEQNNFQFVMQHFGGGFEGKEFPRDYSQQEKDLIQRLVKCSYLPAKTEEEKKAKEVFQTANELTAEYANRPIEPEKGSEHEEHLRNGISEQTSRWKKSEDDHHEHSHAHDDGRAAVPAQERRDADRPGAEVVPAPAQAHKAPSENPFLKHSKGAVCGMGALYAKVEPNGAARRCCHPESDPLGNIFDANFRLLDDAKECFVKSCPCWRTMLVGINEEKWKPMWDTMPHFVQEPSK